jgi:hypothetical protein
VSSRHVKDKEARHVRLYHWLLGTDAWQDLNPIARCAYVELARRYAGLGSNNGRLPCSVREIADNLNVGKSTAQRALTSLQAHGFIVLVKAGGFNMKHRHASEWRLTEFKDDVTGELATKDFARWKKPKHGAARGTHRYPRRDVPVPPGGQSPKVPMGYGTATGTERRNGGATTGTPLVYQGEEPTARTGPARGAVVASPSMARVNEGDRAGGAISIGAALASSATVRRLLKETLQ